MSNNHENADGAEETLEYCLKHYTILPEASHRLNCPWTLWVNLIIQGTSWSDTLKEVNDVESLEEFWSLQSNCKNVEELIQAWQKFEFSFFRKGIVPMTEVDENRRGGRLQFTIEKVSVRDIDIAWLHSILFLACECVKPLEEITGAVLSMKGKAFRIAFWTRSCDTNKVNVLRDIISDMLPEVAVYPSCFTEHRRYA